MAKLMKTVFNCETGELVEREMTKTEIAQYEADKIEFDALKAAEEAKAQTKASLLERLGITADEAKLLLG